MSKIVETKLIDLYPIMVEQLANGGKVEFTPRGTSMLPLIKPGVDSVTLTPIKGKLKKYDLPLYRRESGQFVLHRVVKVNNDGTYTMCGDNQYIWEKGIRHDQLVGLVERLKLGGKTVEVTDAAYLEYCKKQVAKKRRYFYYIKVRSFGGRILRKLGLRK